MIIALIWIAAILAILAFVAKATKNDNPLKLPE